MMDHGRDQLTRSGVSVANSGVISLRIGPGSKHETANPVRTGRGQTGRGRHGGNVGEDEAQSARDHFASRLEELWQAAGAPPLDAVARNARGIRPSSSARLSGKRISAWKTGANVPRSLIEVEGVLHFLVQRARNNGSMETTPGLYDGKHWARWWDAARRASPVRPLAEGFSPIGQAIDDQLDPFDLEVHHAIGEYEGYLLPKYIERDHDRQLGEIVAGAHTRSMLTVLVGSSSTGKTRACWEAIQNLRGWRLWHPLSPGRPEALLNALENNLVPPRTVLWLNEMQYYLITRGNVGEEIAAGLRELLRDSSRAPATW
jgi:hypothetical protein